MVHSRQKPFLRDLAVRTGASSLGTAGILYLKGVPHSWWAQEIDENDLEWMAVIHGDSAWQAEWELLAIVVSGDLWRPLLATRAVALVQTDASAALGVSPQAGRTYSCCEQSGSRTWFGTPAWQSQDKEQKSCTLNFAHAVSAPCHATRACKSCSSPATDTPVWMNRCLRWDLTCSPLQLGPVLPWATRLPLLPAGSIRSLQPELCPPRRQGLPVTARPFASDNKRPVPSTKRLVH